MEGKFFTKSAQQTRRIGAKIAKQFENKNGIIAINGELGSGKTVFVQGFAKGLSIKEKIISPTFILVRQHPIPKTKRLLYHLDLYRLETSSDLKNIGIGEILQDNRAVTIIEWAEKIREALPKNTLLVVIKKISDSNREITVSNHAST